MSVMLTDMDETWVAADRSREQIRIIATNAMQGILFPMRFQG